MSNIIDNETFVSSVNTSPVDGSKADTVKIGNEGSKDVKPLEGKELQQVKELPENKTLVSEYVELLEGLKSGRPRSKSFEKPSCTGEASSASRSSAKELMNTQIFAVKNCGNTEKAEDCSISISAPVTTDDKDNVTGAPIQTMSPSTAETIASQLNNLKGLTNKQLDDRIEILTGLYDQLEKSGELNEASRGTIELAVFELIDAKLLNSLSEGPGLPEKIETGAGLLAELPKDSPALPLFTEGVCTAVRTLASRTGLDAKQLVKHFNGILSTADKSDIKAKTAELEKWIPQLNGSDLPDMCSMIDLLFGDCYPEGYADALLLKQALAPKDKQDDVQLQHDLLLTRSAVYAEFRDIALSNKKDAGMIHSRDIMLHPEAMKEVIGQKGGEDIRNGLACLIRREADAMSKGLSDALMFTMEHMDSDAVKAFDTMSEASKSIFRKESSEHLIQKWDETFGIGGNVRQLEHRSFYDPQMQKQLDNAIDHKMMRFTAGLMGKTEEKQLSQGMRRAGHDLRHLLNESHLSHVLKKDPHYQAAHTLDRLTADLSGVLDPGQRPVSGGSKEEMQKKSSFVDGQIRSNFERIFQDRDGLRSRAALTRLDDEIRQITDRKDNRLDSIKGIRRTFIGHIQALSSEPYDLETQRSHLDEYDDLHRTYSKMKADFANVHAILPHHRGEQRRVCETIRDIAAVQKDISGMEDRILNGEDPSSFESQLTEKIKLRDVLRQELRGLDESKMRLGGDPNHILTVEDIERLSSRADAVLYFRNGHDAVHLKQMESLFADIKRDNAVWKAKLVEARKIYGEKAVDFMRAMITAAVFDAYENTLDEKGQKVPPEKFLPRSEDAEKAIDAKLRAWGVENPHAGFFGALRDRMIFCMCGRGDCLTKNTIDSYTSVKAPDAFSNSSRSIITKSEIKAYEQKTQEIWREKGLRGILDSFGGFGSSCTLSLDRSGKVNLFAAILPKLDFGTVSMGVGADFGVQESDSITISGSYGGGLDVELNGGLAAQFGLNVSACLGNKLDYDVETGISSMSSASSAAVGVGADAGLSKGVSLHFSDKEKCLKFLSEFTKKDSVLQHKHESLFRDTKSKERAEMEQYIDLCSDIRFLYGDSVGVSAFLGVTGPSVRVIFPHSTVSGTLFSLGGSAGYTTNHSVSINVSGYTETYESKISCGFALTGFSCGATTNLVGSKMPETEKMNIDPETGMGGVDNPVIADLATSPSIMITHDQVNTLTQKTSFERTSAGTLKADTSMTNTLDRKNLPLLDGLMALGMTDEEKGKLMASPQHRADMEEMWNSLPSDAKVSLMRPITPEALSKANALEAEIRHATRAGDNKRVKNYKKQYDELLQRGDSFGPATLIMTRLDGLMIAGLGRVGYQGKTFTDTMIGSMPFSVLGYKRQGLYIGTNSAFLPLDAPKKSAA